MDVSAFVTRLQAQVTGLREIGAAAGLEAAVARNLAAPAAYVIPLAETGTVIDGLGETNELEHRLFGVISVVETLDTSGGDAVLGLAGVRSQIKAALIGFVPDDTTGEPVIFMRGEIVQFKGDGRLWWSDEFQLKSYYRSA